MAHDTFPGIEIRVRTDRGEILNSRSDTLHYELMKMWLESGFTGQEWYPVGGTLHGAVLIEVRAVDIPGLPGAPDTAAELGDGPVTELTNPCAVCPSLRHCWNLGRCAIGAALEHMRADVDGQAAELADVDGHAAEPAERCCVCGSADVAYHNYRDQAFCWPCADGRPPAAAADVDGHAAEPGATCEVTWDCGGFEGDRPWHGTRCTRPLGHEGWHHGPHDPTVVDGYITWLVNRPAPPLGGGTETTAPVVADPVRDPASEPGRARSIGSGLARIARRARFRSGRLGDPAAAIQPTIARRR